MTRRAYRGTLLVRVTTYGQTIDHAIRNAGTAFDVGSVEHLEWCDETGCWPTARIDAWEPIPASFKRAADEDDPD